MDQKAYKFRLYPNVKQEIRIAETFGCVRQFWNHCVDSWNKKEKPNSAITFRNSDDKKYMSDVSAAAIQQKERDFLEFKNQRFAKTRKKQLGSPKFKSKRDKQSFRLPNQKFKIYNNKIRLEKIGWIKIVLDRDFPENSRFLSVTISKNKAGQYFASVLVEEKIENKRKTGKTVGIDVGLTNFLATSEGEFVENPRYLRESQAKIAKIQQYQSRKRGSKKGQTKSNRWIKNQKRLNRLHLKVANQRQYFLHEVSTHLVSNYDLISIEDLDVQNMMEDSYMAKSIGDVSWSMFFSMLDYKCKWYGKTLVKVDRYAPTSKTCSGCGHYFKDLTLKDREICCPNCGVLDRDTNAAINIKALGVDSAIRTP